MTDEDERRILKELIAIRGDMARLLESVSRLEVAMNRLEVEVALLQMDVARMSLMVARRLGGLVDGVAAHAHLRSHRYHPGTPDPAE